MRIVLCMLVLAATSTSHADPRRYTRKTVVPAAPAAAKPVAAKHVLPTEPATAEQVMAVDLATDVIRQEQEVLLGRLVGDTPDDDPDKPDYLFRLAERYAQQARLFRIEAIGLELSAQSHD
jgi:hypothetical protein